MRFFLTLFILVFVIACGSDVPNDVMPTNKMQSVLYDVIRADEMVEFKRLSDSTYHSFSKRSSLYDTIFQLHSIDKAIFQKSLKYYQGRPDLLKEMLDSLEKKVTDTIVHKPVRK